jgi:glycosyltransferase involved in cell wall biosynthesis
MRIAQVAPLYESVPPKLYGGTERVVAYLTQELVAMGHDVTLFASGDSITGARLVPIRARALRLDPLWADDLGPHMLQLERVLQQEPDFDVIHFHLDCLHFLVCRRLSVPCVTTLHGRLDQPHMAPIYAEYRDVPVCAISSAQRSTLPDVNWCATVHHGLPSELHRPSVAGGDYFAFLGRISPEKGVDRAIEIAKRLGVRLKIAAKVDRKDAAYHRDHIAPLLDHPLIEFIGEISEHQKAAFLGGARALLFPIDWPEPFGLVMIEAMACGTPVIAFDRGSVPELIDHGVTGFLVRDVEQAVQAAARVGELDRRLCRATFERRFTAARMAREYLAAYTQLIGRRRGDELARATSEVAA